MPTTKSRLAVMAQVLQSVAQQKVAGSLREPSAYANRFSGIFLITVTAHGVSLLLCKISLGWTRSLPYNGGLPPAAWRLLSC
jgi:hypothetical protein